MTLEPCPYLPIPGRTLTSRDLHALGADRGPRFHHTALNYAQSLWLAGSPAQALLLVNRALSCRLPGVPLSHDPGRSPADRGAPYHAVAWILTHRPAGRFIGNPRRHFQHLATRMVEPHRELRVWRAWACWHLAHHLLSEDEFPADLRQMREEGIVEPRRAEVARALGQLSPADDRSAWESALALAGPPPEPAADISIRPIGAEETGIVNRLAHRIWPEAYGAILDPKQIRYMLGRMYEPEVLRDDVTRRGIHYALIREGTEDIGFLAWEEPRDGGSPAFLHKLYLLPDRHGRGVGAQALRWVEEAARARGLPALRLRVNRGNARAIRAYLRAGFRFEGEIRSDIGGGFVMDDFILEKPLTAA